MYFGYFSAEIWFSKFMSGKMVLCLFIYLFLFTNVMLILVLRVLMDVRTEGVFSSVDSVNV